MLLKVSYIINYLDYHQYLKSKLESKMNKELNKKEMKYNKEKIISKKNKNEEIDLDTIILNDNWVNERVENHFLKCNNSDRIKLLEIN